jgi:hypothetical protein
VSELSGEGRTFLNGPKMRKNLIVTGTAMSLLAALLLGIKAGAPKWE